MIKRKSTLSVCAISLNEENNLPDFLENVFNVADELIIVDDGSTDRTLEIIKAYPKPIKFISHPTVTKDFASQRNLGIKQASSDWILHMDIDERITPELGRSILSMIENESLNGFRYYRADYFMNRYMRGGGFNKWNHPQLARNGKHQFNNELHEKCIIEGGENKIGQLDGFMIHLTDNTYQDRLPKSYQYSIIKSKMWIKENVTVSWYHLFTRPFLRFFKRYFLQRGYKDGVHGLLFALHCFVAVFTVNAIVWSKRNNIDRQKIESKIKLDWKKIK